MKKALLVGLLLASVSGTAQAVTFRFTGTTFTSSVRTVNAGNSVTQDDAGPQTVAGSLAIDPTLGVDDPSSGYPISYTGPAGFITATFTSTGATPQIVDSGTPSFSIIGDADTGENSLTYAFEDADGNGGLRTTSFTFYSSAPVSFVNRGGLLLPDYRSAAPGSLFFDVTTRIGTLDDYVETVSQGEAAFAVPEPATWATMALGFGLLGGALRRRRGAVATA